MNNLPKVVTQLLPRVGFGPMFCWSQVQQCTRCATGLPPTATTTIVVALERCPKGNRCPSVRSPAAATEPLGPGGQLFQVPSPHAEFDPHFLSAIPTLTPTFCYPPRPLESGGI